MVEREFGSCCVAYSWWLLLVWKPCGGALQVRDELVMVAAAFRGASMVNCSSSFWLQI